MEQVLLVVQVLLAIGLIGMVLIQRSDSDGFGLSGGGGNLMSGRTAANTMTRITAVLATLFIVNSLALSVLATSGRAPSIIESIEEQQSQGNAVPAVPTAGDAKKDVKKPAAKVDEKTSTPSVPAADADAKPAVVKKTAKKVVAPIEGDEAATNE